MTEQIVWRGLVMNIRSKIVHLGGKCESFRYGHKKYYRSVRADDRLNPHSLCPNCCAALSKLSAPELQELRNAKPCFDLDDGLVASGWHSWVTKDASGLDGSATMDGGLSQNGDTNTESVPNSRVHRAFCEWAGEFPVRQHQDVRFESMDEARTAGYEPCKDCKPDKLLKGDLDHQFHLSDCVDICPQRIQEKLIRLSSMEEAARAGNDPHCCVRAIRGFDYLWQQLNTWLSLDE